MKETCHFLLKLSVRKEGEVLKEIGGLCSSCCAQTYVIESLGVVDTVRRAEATTR